ncbi:hypothetical protein ACVW1A_004814 [Bradyrhizobium sp. LB1.3]
MVAPGVKAVCSAAWPASGSVTRIVPATVSVAPPTSSVTVVLFGSPITAGVLAPPPPWIVNEICFWVPSSEVTVKVSSLTSAAPRDCTAELTTE